MSGVTGKQMCETIVEVLKPKKDDGTPITPEEFWNASPTGGLFHVFEWYGIAMDVKEYLAKKRSKK